MPGSDLRGVQSWVEQVARLVAKGASGAIRGVPGLDGLVVQIHDEVTVTTLAWAAARAEGLTEPQFGILKREISRQFAEMKRKEKAATARKASNPKPADAYDAAMKKKGLFELVASRKPKPTA